MRLANSIRLFVIAAIMAACLAIDAGSCKAADAAAPSCAIIVNGAKSADATTLAALVESTLSQTGTVRLIERQQVDRIIAEQALCKSGLIDADKAVAVGKLISADVLAIIDSEDDEKTSGEAVVVFDTNTGVRLWDAAVNSTSERSADEIAKAIDAAVVKRASGQFRAGVRTICLQAVRNADLPRDADGVCRAAGAILMRQLGSSPDVAVLERARLQHVTEERQLTDVDSALIASTISIELQVARAGGDAVDVSAVLIDSNGTQTGVAPVHVNSARPDVVAAAILPPLAATLRVTPPARSTDAQRAAESKRFTREAMLRWQHGDIADALDAAEAAHALNPADRQAAAARARALLVCGTTLAYYGDFADPFQRIDVWMRIGDPRDPSRPRIEPDDLTLSLQLVLRAADALKEVGYVPATKPSTAYAHAGQWNMFQDNLPLVHCTEELLRQYVGHLRWEMFDRKLKGTGIAPLTLSETQAALFHLIQEDFRRRRLDIEYPAARALVTDRRTFAQYTGFLSALLFDARCIWPADGEEWTGEWARLLPDWIALARQFGEPQSSTPFLVTHHSVPWLDFWSNRQYTQSMPIFPAGSRVAAVPAALHDLVPINVRQNWAGCYFDYNWKMTDADWQRLVATCDALATAPVADPHQIAQGARSMSAAAAKSDVVLGAFSRPADANAPPVRHFIAPRPLQPAKVDAPPSVGPGTVWPDSHVLVDFDAPSSGDSKHSGDALAFPRVDGEGRNAYALVQRDRDSVTPRLELLKFDLHDYRSTTVSSLVRSQDDRQSVLDLANANLNGSSAAIAAGYYVFCDPRTGIYLFPLDGAPPRMIDRVSANLPAEYFQVATVLGDSLFLAVGSPGREGYLLAYGLKDGLLKTLSTGRRLAPATGPAAPLAEQAAASPFDDAAPMFVWCMLADEPRKRILFLASNNAWSRGLAGWWSYQPAAHRFHQLLAADMPEPAGFNSSAVWATQRADQLVFGGTSVGLSRIDLVTDKTSSMPPPPDAPNYTGPGIRGVGQLALAQPLFQAGGWIWGKFGRYRMGDAVVNSRHINTPELQSFDPLRNADIQWGQWPLFLEPIDADHVVIGDARGLWFLHVPSADPAVLARLVQPARPLTAPVEPMGPPPVGGELPWEHVTTVYDILKNVNAGDGKARFMRMPQIVGDNLFVLACGDGPFGEDTARLIRFSIATGQRTELGVANARGLAAATCPTRAMQAEISLQSAGCAIDERYYYAALPSGAVICFPLDGSKPQTINFHTVGDSSVTDCAVVKDKLFVSLIDRPGTEPDDSHSITRLFRVDMKTLAREELPLPAPSADSVPPSHVPPLQLRLLRADPSRQRVVFFINQMSKANHAIDGLWTCAAGGDPQRLAAMDVWPATGQRLGESIFDWADRVRGDEWLVYSRNGAVKIHMPTLAVQRLWQCEPAGQAPLDGRYDLRAPLVECKGSLWDSGLHRVKLDGAAFDQAPSMRPMNTRNYGRHLQFLDSLDKGARLVVADNCGLWIVDLDPAK